MKIMKHLLYVAFANSKRMFCKHKSTYSAACPFTGKTYINCEKCLKRMNVVDTYEQ
jgi:hypothetical protein